MPGYVTHRAQGAHRLPLRGRFDLTYRCNLDCRHCWLRLPAAAPERAQELDLSEIRDFADQGRALGCREWSLSGGEPMLRADFAEVFDYLTAGGAPYSLNTNGTLITPAIAQLLRRRGAKMIALYGATPEVCDDVTRVPGSFERTMRGMNYLREAGAGFTVQVVPMRANFHQLDDMIGLAESLGRPWRVGAAWLNLSAAGDEARNAEIRRQRLAPADVIALDKPDPSGGGDAGGALCAGAPMASCGAVGNEGRTDDRLFASCIAVRRDFHVDPYGCMSFCSFIKDPALRYDLRRGTVREAWETFVPGVAERARGGSEYVEHCATCALRSECRYCPVYGYLEHRRHAAPVEYLCGVARESRRFREDWRANHRRYYRVGGLTVQVDADLPFADDTFAPNIEAFRVDEPADDNIVIRHQFSLPSLDPAKLGVEVYRQPPWAIYRKGGAWIYVGISPGGRGGPPHRVAVFDRDHRRGRIYSPDEENFRKGGVHALTLFPTDQILLSRVLAHHNGCFLHSSGAILNGQGLLFVGHSGAGKSTMVKLLQASARVAAGRGGGAEAEILCDDRNIVRRYADGFRVFGSWSHGEVPAVSTGSAPLRAVLFLEQASENRALPMQDRRDITRRLLACLIKPLQTADWWDQMMLLLQAMARQVPCYRLRFDRSGQVVTLLDEMTCRDVRSAGDVA